MSQHTADIIKRLDTILENFKVNGDEFAYTEEETYKNINYYKHMDAQHNVLFVKVYFPEPKDGNLDNKREERFKDVRSAKRAISRFSDES